MTTSAPRVRSRYLSSLTITLTPAGGRSVVEGKFHSPAAVRWSDMLVEEGKVKREETFHIQRG